MRFCGEVHDDVRLFLLEDLIHACPVADVELDESEVIVLHHRLQCMNIPCISELIQTNDPIVRVMLHHIKDEIRADKSCAAGYDNCHSVPLTFV